MPFLHNDFMDIESFEYNQFERPLYIEQIIWQIQNMNSVPKKERKGYDIFNLIGREFKRPEESDKDYLLRMVRHCGISLADRVVSLNWGNVGLEFEIVDKESSFHAVGNYSESVDTYTLRYIGARIGGKESGNSRYFPRPTIVKLLDK